MRLLRSRITAIAIHLIILLANTQKVELKSTNNNKTFPGSLDRPNVSCIPTSTIYQCTSTWNPDSTGTPPISYVVSYNTTNLGPVNSTAATFDVLPIYDATLRYSVLFVRVTAINAAGHGSPSNYAAVKIFPTSVSQLIVKNYQTSSDPLQCSVIVYCSVITSRADSCEVFLYDRKMQLVRNLSMAVEPDGNAIVVAKNLKCGSEYSVQAAGLLDGELSGPIAPFSSSVLTRFKRKSRASAEINNLEVKCAANMFVNRCQIKWQFNADSSLKNSYNISYSYDGLKESMLVVNASNITLDIPGPSQKYADYLNVSVLIFDGSQWVQYGGSVLTEIVSSAVSNISISVIGVGGELDANTDSIPINDVVFICNLWPESLAGACLMNFTLDNFEIRNQALNSTASLSAASQLTCGRRYNAVALGLKNESAVGLLSNFTFTTEACTSTSHTISMRLIIVISSGIGVTIILVAIIFISIIYIRRWHKRRHKKRERDTEKNGSLREPLLQRTVISTAGTCAKPDASDSFNAQSEDKASSDNGIAEQEHASLYVPALMESLNHEQKLPESQEIEGESSGMSNKSPSVEISVANKQQPEIQQDKDSKLSENGELKVSAKPQTSMKSHPFLCVESGTFDHKGGAIKLPGYNVLVYIPKEAIAYGERIEVKIGASLQVVGKYQLPTGYTRISPFVWFWASNYKFQRSVQMYFQHHVASSTAEDLSNLLMAASSDSGIDTEDDVALHADNTNGVFEFGSNVCVYSTKQSTVACAVAQEPPLCHGLFYCFVHKTYKYNENSLDFTTDLCFSIANDYCQKMIEKQYMEKKDHLLLPTFPKSFTFLDADDQNIDVEYQEQCGEWYVCINGKNSLTTQDLDFRAFTHEELTILSETKNYPPRITLRFVHTTKEVTERKSMKLTVKLDRHQLFEVDIDPGKDFATHFPVYKRITPLSQEVKPQEKGIRKVFTDYYEDLCIAVVDTDRLLLKLVSKKVVNSVQENDIKKKKTCNEKMTEILSIVDQSLKKGNNDIFIQLLDIMKNNESILAKTLAAKVESACLKARALELQLTPTQ